MFWNLFFGHTGEAARPLQVYLHHHSIVTFRVLLFSGNLLILALLWYFQPIFQRQPQSFTWIAALAAILSILFLFSILSTRINGHRRYSDPWLGLATGTMILLSIAALYHM